jgi:hypothetical protein
MAWFSRLRALFGRKKLAREQDEELEFHLAMREQWNLENGLANDEAERDARLRFGNPRMWRERMSEIDLMLLPQTVLQDLRYGTRMLLRNAGFTRPLCLRWRLALARTRQLSPRTRHSSSDLSMHVIPDEWLIWP